MTFKNIVSMILGKNHVKSIRIPRGACIKRIKTVYGAKDVCRDRDAWGLVFSGHVKLKKNPNNALTLPKYKYEPPYKSGLFATIYLSRPTDLLYISEFRYILLRLYKLNIILPLLELQGKA